MGRQGGSVNFSVPVTIKDDIPFVRVVIYLKFKPLVARSCCSSQFRDYSSEFICNSKPNCYGGDIKNESTSSNYRSMYLDEKRDRRIFLFANKVGRELCLQVLTFIFAFRISN